MNSGLEQGQGALLFILEEKEVIMPDGIQISINLDLKEIRDIIFEQCCETCRDKCWNKILDKAADSANRNVVREILKQQLEGEVKPAPKR